MARKFFKHVKLLAAAAALVAVALTESDALAQRIGCSLSTVKRHLRQERSGGQPSRRCPRPMPSMRDVLAAARRVLYVERARGTTAA